MADQKTLDEVVVEMYEVSCGAEPKALTKCRASVKAMDIGEGVRFVMAHRILKRLWNEHYLVNSTTTNLNPDYKIKWLDEIAGVIEEAIRGDD